jgi:hypothetical protein
MDRCDLAARAEGGDVGVGKRWGCEVVGREEFLSGGECFLFIIHSAHVFAIGMRCEYLYSHRCWNAPISLFIFIIYCGLAFWLAMLVSLF